MRPTLDLSAGQNAPVSPGALDVRLRRLGQADPDLVALLLDDHGKVGADADFVFYTAPQHPSGSVALAGNALRVDPARVPAAVERIVVAAHDDAAMSCVMSRSSSARPRRS